MAAQTYCKMTQPRRELVGLGHNYGSWVVTRKKQAGKRHQRLIMVGEFPFCHLSRIKQKINQIVIEIKGFLYNSSHLSNKFN